ncbi:right-handed parallel beta-helix repeat-containing protein [Tumebacillus flagellatus]|uniref:right-handed parallel beta-helix repeat-containing protein n=1 Tax=Tumebacillus flagellatus TaxID=1157490 RepID=UPI0009DE5CB7|nr:NosD domain-containing protein [Tumebacillus flagellatus]
MSALRRSVRVIFCSVAVVVSAICSSAYASTSISELQVELDRAEAGELVKLPPGTYEGTLHIRKPIQVEGDETRIISRRDAVNEEPLLLVETNGAAVRGLQLEGNQAGLVVHGDNNRIQDVSISTGKTAIKLEKSNRNLVQRVRINGRTADLEQRGNGIEVRNSQDNLIEESTLDNLQDGVYLDNSARTFVRTNHISNSRYAVHMMFSNSSEVAGNILEHNVTGAMVMEDSGSQIAGNSITKQAEHVQSQGILLYHVQGAKVVRNTVDGNRIGLYVDSSTGNYVEGNQIMHNFLGLQMKDSTGNEFLANTWAGNVIQAQAADSHENLMKGNYWEDHQGLDLNGDGHSEISYQASPFFLSLTEAVPAYQLFFQTPGLAILQDLFTSGTDNWLRDESPLMSPASRGVREKTSSRGLLIGISLLLLGAGIMPFGRRIRRRVQR